MFTDAILYVPDFLALVTHLNEAHPNLLERDETGGIAMPPVITGFARTPAVTKENAVMVYARLRPDEVDQWRGIPGVEVLAEAEFAGRGTAQSIYDQVFNDPAKLAKYDSVHDRVVVHIDEESGEEIEYEQPWFGVLAGA